MGERPHPLIGDIDQAKNWLRAKQEGNAGSETQPADSQNQGGESLTGNQAEETQELDDADLEEVRED